MHKTPKAYFNEAATTLRPSLGSRESEALAQRLLEEIWHLTPADLIVNRPFEVESHQHREYDEALRRLLRHEPIQYIFSEADFYGRKFYVDPHVLIPRQETELMIRLISEYKAWDAPRIADVGTGSGCIACSLALEIKKSDVLAYDISRPALAIAQRNASQLRCRVDFHPVDLLAQPLPHANLDLLVSNPPYIPEAEKAAMSPNVWAFEPSSALFVPNDDPLLFYRMILKKARKALKSGGVVFFEIHEKLQREVLSLVEAQGYTQAKIYHDLNDKPRFVSAER